MENTGGLFISSSNNKYLFSSPYVCPSSKTLQILKLGVGIARYVSFNHLRPWIIYSYKNIAPDQETNTKEMQATWMDQVLLTTSSYNPYKKSADLGHKRKLERKRQERLERERTRQKQSVSDTPGEEQPANTKQQEDTSREQVKQETDDNTKQETEKEAATPTNAQVFSLDDLEASKKTVKTLLPGFYSTLKQFVSEESNDEIEKDDAVRKDTTDPSSAGNNNAGDTVNDETPSEKEETTLKVSSYADVGTFSAAGARIRLPTRSVTPPIVGRGVRMRYPLKQPAQGGVTQPVNPAVTVAVKSAFSSPAVSILKNVRTPGSTGTSSVTGQSVAENTSEEGALEVVAEVVSTTTIPVSSTISQSSSATIATHSADSSTVVTSSTSGESARSSGAGAVRIPAGGQAVIFSEDNPLRLDMASVQQPSVKAVGMTTPTLMGVIQSKSVMQSATTVQTSSTGGAVSQKLESLISSVKNTFKGIDPSRIRFQNLKLPEGASCNFTVMTEEEAKQHGLLSSSSSLLSGSGQIHQQRPPVLRPGKSILRPILSQSTSASMTKQADSSTKEQSSISLSVQSQSLLASAAGQAPSSNQEQSSISPSVQSQSQLAPTALQVPSPNQEQSSISPSVQSQSLLASTALQVPSSNQEQSSISPSVQSPSPSVSTAGQTDSSSKEQSVVPEVESTAVNENRAEKQDKISVDESDSLPQTEGPPDTESPSSTNLDSEEIKVVAESSQFQKEEGLKPSTSETKAKTVYRRIRIIPRPWRTPDGTVNRPILRMMLEGILTYIMTRPGLTYENLMRKYNPILQPVCLLELLDILLTAGCISKHCIHKKESPSLFSKRVVFYEDEVETKQSIAIYCPTVDCVLKLGQYEVQLQKHAVS